MGTFNAHGEYVALVTYEEREVVDMAAKHVRDVHERLGLSDPHLLLWVHASMVDAFLDTARRSGMPITDAEADQYLYEMVTFAKLVGIPEVDVPASVNELAQYMKDIYPELIASEEAKRPLFSCFFHLCQSWCDSLHRLLHYGLALRHWPVLHFQIGPAIFTGGHQFRDKISLLIFHCAHLEMPHCDCHNLSARVH